MGIEQRAAPRFTTSIPVGLRFPIGESQEGWGRIINLSAVGILLETRFRVKVADILYLTFSLRDGLQFENLRARAIRVAQEEGYFLAGIAFDDIVDQETLRDVITALAFEGGLPLT